MIGALIKAELDQNSIESRLRLWCIQRINLEKIIKRMNIAHKIPSASVKAVLFEFSSKDKIDSAFSVKNALYLTDCFSFLKEFLDCNTVYIRKKPVFHTDGTSSLSTSEYQMIALWN
jgi:hypothetical protein